MQHNPTISTRWERLPWYQLANRAVVYDAPIPCITHKQQTVQRSRNFIDVLLQLLNCTSCLRSNANALLHNIRILEARKATGASDHEKPSSTIQSDEIGSGDHAMAAEKRDAYDMRKLGVQQETKVG
jgi:hypothetical protein